MELRFHGLSADLEQGVRLLEDKLGFRQSEDGYPIRVTHRAGRIEVCADTHGVELRYERKIHFFRGLGLLIEALRNAGETVAVDLCEEPQFDFNGMMFDVSRNAVMSLDSIKQFILHMAVMGLNGFILYTEDTFAIDDNEYFGYMRGKYSFNEMKALDDLADTFGIEVVPCIQTLGHVEHALKWNNATNIRDTHDIFLVGEPETYAFIEQMIRHASAPLRSKRIHIGMDEAHALGLGQYLRKNGVQPRFEIMNTHLRSVLRITKALGLKPMIWSDMYFRLGSKTGDYYDQSVDFPDNVVADIPDNVSFVYWDYYHHDADHYARFIRKHRTLGSVPIFAGGIWTWNGLCPSYRKTWLTSEAALTVCKAEGVREVFATMWGDNGGETNLLCALPGMQLFAEHGYAREVDGNKLASRFSFCTGGRFDDFMLLEKPDLISEEEGNRLTLYSPPNPSKFLLWQDPLLGLFDKHAEGRSLGAYYAELEREIEAACERGGIYEPLFRFYAQLCGVLKIKSEIGLRLKQAYDGGLSDELRQLADEVLPDLHTRLTALRAKHRDLWMGTCKPFGWEVLDIRYGGALARLDTAIERLTGYLSGRLERLEELEECRLYFDGPRTNEWHSIGSINAYSRIATAGNL